ncbi:bestrophin-like domain [Nocardiopsis alborubida]|uniref:DUF4239 domain-containing protein n=1 Tax=Nocardiopsis alborubida TaxID=146802 RepID=A0A7X6M8S4_9ACTN|nr:DUF4239 domain-containing protein [Nocardiopsis alborubida]NKY96470.1 DUF4239 domain-containing protein [Nocardiopsis alborubida]
MMTMLTVLAVLAAMVGGAVLAVGRFRVDDESSGGAVSVVVAPCVLALYLAAAAMGVVIGWENFTGAGDGLTEETGAADALYWSTTTLPAEEAETVRQQLRAYMSAVAEEDWPMMRAEGELSEEGDEALADLAASVRALSVSDTGDGLDRLTARQELAELSDARIERADAAGDGIPSVLNGIAALSAIAVAVLPFAMIRRGSTVAYFWASANLVFVFATILLLFYLGNPYNGALAHDAGAVQDTLAGFDRIDASLDASPSPQ